MDMELAVELELDNWQFSLLRAEVRSGSGFRRVGSCLTKLLRRLYSTEKRQNFIYIRWLLLWSIFTPRKLAIETLKLKISSVDEMKLETSKLHIRQLIDTCNLVRKMSPLKLCTFFM